MKIGDKAITKIAMGTGKHKAGEVVQIIEVRKKKDGFTKKNYLVKYSNGDLGCWTRWELKKIDLINEPLSEHRLYEYYTEKEKEERKRLFTEYCR